MFALRESLGSVEVAFTDRHGPEGRPLTLSDPAGVAVVAEEFARHGPLIAMTQVHGADVAVVDRAAVDPPVADALVTATAGCALLVRVADCVPVLIADPRAGVVGAVHAGREGLVAGVVTAALEAMAGLGAERPRAWVGPSVCGGCYEVPEPMQEAVCDRVPEARSRTRWGTPSLDLATGVGAQLRRAGVAFSAVGRCTREDDDLWSYRRDGAAAGRLGGLIQVVP